MGEVPAREDGRKHPEKGRPRDGAHEAEVEKSIVDRSLGSDAHPAAVAARISHRREGDRSFVGAAFVSNPGGEGPEVENRADDGIAVENASGEKRRVLRPPGRLRVEPRARDSEKDSRLRAAEIDEAAASGRENFESFPLAPDPDLEGEVVPPAERKDRESGPVLAGDANETVHHRVQGPVAARDHENVVLFATNPRRSLAHRFRGAGRLDGNPRALRLQERFELAGVFPPRGAARSGILEKQDSHVSYRVRV